MISLPDANPAHLQTSPTQRLRVHGIHLAVESGAPRRAGDRMERGAVVHLRGEPDTRGSSATSAELRFHPDGDIRAAQPPRFDAEAGCIRASFPMSYFGTIRDLAALRAPLFCEYFEHPEGAPQQCRVIVEMDAA